MSTLKTFFSSLPRTFRGGFIGGFCGIASFWYFEANAWLAITFLTAGCFGGVVIGYWFDEIMHGLAARACAIVSLRKSIPARRARLAARFSSAVKCLCRWAENCGQKASQLICSSTQWLISRPSAGYHWLKKDCLRLANIAVYCATLIYSCLNLLWINAYFGPVIGQTIIGYPEAILFFLLLFCCLTFFTAPVIKFKSDLTPGKKTRRRTLWRKQYRHYGFPLFMLRKLGDMLALQLYTGFVMLVVFVIYSIFFYSGLILFILPFTVALLLSRSFTFATKHEHLPCFGITLAVTGLMVWLTHSYFTDIKTMLTVAFSTGIISGLVSHFGLKAIESLLAGSPRWQLFTHLSFSYRPCWYQKIANQWAILIKNIYRPRFALEP